MRFYWQLVEHFARAPGTWRSLGGHWAVECALEIAHPATLRTIITAGPSFRTGRFTMSVRAQLIGGKSLAYSRAVLRETCELAELLRRNGYRWRDEPLAYYPQSAWKSLTPRSFAAERRFLSALTNSSPGAFNEARPRSLDELLETFRGRAAGDWRPVRADWSLRKPLRICGRPAHADCQFQLVPADAHGRLGIVSTVTIWPPWSRKGRLPSWLARAGRDLDSQFEAIGHKPEWHRGPEGRGVMVTSMREDLDGLTDVVQERRALEQAQFGDT